MFYYNYVVNIYERPFGGENPPVIAKLVNDRVINDVDIDNFLTDRSIDPIIDEQLERWFDNRVVEKKLDIKFQNLYYAKIVVECSCYKYDDLWNISATKSKRSKLMVCKKPERRYWYVDRLNRDRLYEDRLYNEDGAVYYNENTD
jgi:hypothetical protein